MADSELVRHQEFWHGFTRFLTGGTIVVIVIVIGMAVFLA